MPRAAVLGSPVGHSLSPVLHAAAYAALGLTDWTYAAHEVREDDLATFVAGLGEDWRGLSLTMPLKEVAFDVAATVSPDARRTGAVNTLVRRVATGEWDAHNTDVHGLVAALAERLPGTPRTAMVLGGGATARSALVALERLGVAAVTVAVRNPDKVAGLRDQVGLGVPLDVVPLDGWAGSLAEADVVVSTLPPAGGVRAAEVLGATAAPARAGRGVSATLLDVVYADWPTSLAQGAQERGLTVVPGTEMLLHQAVEQVRLMTGQEPPVGAMREALLTRIR